MKLGFLLVFAACLQANEYVDSRTCAACHQKIDQTFRETGMGRSVFRPSPLNTIEDYRNKNEYLHTASNTHFAMIVRGKEYFQRRWQIGFDGKETNVEELKIDYVIGSGNHARSYLHRTATGGFIELPLGWYAQRAGYWAMSPGFDSPHPLTRRYASYQCIFCHDSYPTIPSGHDAPGSDAVFSNELPEGIDCQRCHGAGAGHVRIARTAGAKAEEIRTSILNPSRLKPSLQMDVCLQCHLEPTSGALPSLIRRFRRGPFSFTPGEPLANFLLFFDHAPGTGYDDKFEIVNSSAYRLAKSKCFVKSAGAMTCTTCHDPHLAPRGADAIAQYSAACQHCHATIARAAGHPTSKECIGCHMMKRQTDDVVDAEMTDHWIQRRPAPRALSAAREYRGEVVPYRVFSQPVFSQAEDAAYTAVAQVLHQNNLIPGVAELTRQIAKMKTPEPEFYRVLGQALLSAGKPGEALKTYEQALRVQPGEPGTLLALAGAWSASGQTGRAREYLTLALKAAPLSAVAWAHAGLLDSAAGLDADSIRDFRNAVAIDPDYIACWTALGRALSATGSNLEAETTLRHALQMDPYDATAYDLLGRLLAGKGESNEALFDFRKATELRPKFAPHLYDYALELAAVSRNDESEMATRAALGEDRDMAEAHELLGRLMAGKKKLAEAEREYLETIRLKPELARAHLDLARVLAAEGKEDAAIRELRLAAEGKDPQVASLAADALRRLGR